MSNLATSKIQIQPPFKLLQTRFRPFWSFSIFNNSILVIITRVVVVGSKLVTYGWNSGYNHSDPNKVDISGALFTWRIRFEYTQTQSEDSSLEEGARDVNDIWVPMVRLYENG